MTVPALTRFLDATLPLYLAVLLFAAPYAAARLLCWHDGRAERRRRAALHAPTPFESTPRRPRA